MRKISADGKALRADLLLNVSHPIHRGIFADWLDDSGRHAEADSVRQVLLRPVWRHIVGSWKAMCYACGRRRMAVVSELPDNLHSRPSKEFCIECFHLAGTDHPIPMKCRQCGAGADRRKIETIVGNEVVTVMPVDEDDVNELYNVRSACKNCGCRSFDHVEPTT
jgi:hypothetical protein